MHYEVEQKYRVQQFHAVEVALAELGAVINPALEQTDIYFQHPARDYRVTDEAFRVRRTGSRNCVTYKGPRIDTTSKTRRELELSLPDGPEYHAKFIELLAAIGFDPVGEVRKRRRKAFVPWNGSTVEVSLDDVVLVGNFVELELVADERGVDESRRILGQLARHLRLTDQERRSYLELLPDAGAKHP
jgi:adenylate cyclase class 2